MFEVLKRHPKLAVDVEGESELFLLVVGNESPLRRSASTVPTLKSQVVI